jgi:hypothetical protein
MNIFNNEGKSLEQRITATYSSLYFTMRCDAFSLSTISETYSHLQDILYLTVLVWKDYLLLRVPGLSC